MNSNIITVIAVIGLVIAVLVLAFKPFTGPSSVVPGERNTISATGTSETKVMPDESSVYLAVETLKDTADDSKTENSIISDRVMSSLKRIGIRDSDIETMNYNIYPDYDWSSGKQRLKGYKTTNTIKVKTDDFSLLGKIIDAGVEAGVNRVDSIQFGLSSEREATAKKDALEKASKDAREKAEATASGLGVKLGKIVSVSTQDYYYQPYRFFEGGMAMEAKAGIAAAPQINPQELETRASVSVVFELK